MNTKNSLKVILLILVCLLLLNIVGCTSTKIDKSNSTEDDKIVLTVAVGAFTPETPRGQLYSMLEEKLTEVFGERFEWNMLTPGSIGADKDMMTACISGEVDFINLGDMVADMLTGKLGWAFLPMMYSDYNDVDERYFNGWVAEEIEKAYEEMGLIKVGNMEGGFRMPANTKREIKSMDDFKGLKLRVAEISYLTNFYKYCGALPIAMANTEVITSIEQGAIDGQDNYLTAMKNMGTLEMTKYISKLNYLYCGNSLLVSKKFWDGLSPEDQVAFKQVCTDCGNNIIPIAREDEMNIQNEGIANSSLVFTEPSEEFKLEVKKIAMRVWEEESVKYDTRLMERVFAEFGIE